jgi:glutaredoxin
MQRTVLKLVGLHDEPPLQNSDASTYIVYGARWCGYTSAARQLLKDQGKRFVFHDFNDDREARNAVSARAGNHSTLPMIFQGARFVGGYTQLAAELSQQQQQ